MSDNKTILADLDILKSYVVSVRLHLYFFFWCAVFLSELFSASPALLYLFGRSFLLRNNHCGCCPPVVELTSSITTVSGVECS